MQNQEIVKEWITFAEMDYQTALHLYQHMYPKPFEIICYHCQQAVEKMLKGFLIAYGGNVQRTHDLGLLAENLHEFIEIPEEYYEICDNLTPYGVKVRYPQELYLEESHIIEALDETKKIFSWLKELFENIE